MNLQTLALPALVLVGLTSLTLLLSRGWRSGLPALCLQYLGVFLLVAQAWPLGMAATKVVAGWISGALLGMALLSLPLKQTSADRPVRSALEPTPFQEPHSPAEAQIHPDSSSLLGGRLFQLLAAALVWLAVLSASGPAAQWVPGIAPESAQGALLLIGMGLLQLGFASRPLRNAFGLLTALSGFEILYAAVEASTLVAGLLTAVTLLLALAHAYLLIAPSMEVE